MPELKETRKPIVLGSSLALTVPKFILDSVTDSSDKFKLKKKLLFEITYNPNIPNEFKVKILILGEEND